MSIEIPRPDNERPQFKSRHEIERPDPDPDKVPYDFYTAHPEWRPRSTSRGVSRYEARRRVIRSA